MTIAVTYDAGQIWQHFGKTENFRIYEVEDYKIINSIVVGTNGASHGALATFLASKGVDAVICGGVGAPMVDKLKALDMRVYPGVTGKADDAVLALLNGTLQSNESAIHEGCNHNHLDH